MVSLEGTQDVKLWDTDRWGAYQRNDFSEPRFLHLPIQGKALNSLTWVIWFSFIYDNLLIFRLPALCCKTSIWPGSSPPSLARSSSNPQGYPRCCLQGRSPKGFYQIEHNCQLLGCECFLSLQFLPIHSPIASGNHHSILCFFHFDHFGLLI